MKQIKSKHLILASQDQKKIFTSTFSVNGIDFIINNMKHLVQLEDPLKKSIHSQLIGLRKTAFGDFNSAEGLELYFYKTNNKIIVVSVGEKQPMLFQLWCEGIWEINSVA